MDGPFLLVTFVASIVVLLLLIIKFRWHAFLALLFTAILTSLVAGIPLTEIPGTITVGFGNTLAGVGIVIGLGVILGKLLALSGATTTIATSILKIFGKEKSVLAVATAGWIISIPVFFDAALVLLMPLIRNLSRKTGIAFASFVAALSIGLLASHASVVPTPGPLIVAENFGLNVGTFFIYGIIMSVPAVFVGGYLYGLFLNKKFTSGAAGPITDETDVDIETLTEGKKLPGAFLSFFLIVLPIALILSNTVTGMVLPEGNLMREVLALIGEKNVALLIAVIVGVWTLQSYIVKDINEAYMEAIKDAGIIILITGAGGAFGTVIRATGIGDYVVEATQSWSIPLVILGFLLSQMIRIAQGSTTVSLVTASSVLGPVVATHDGSGILVALAICAGGVGLCMPNDSGFWVVQRFSNFNMKETFQVWTVGGTILGLTSLLIVLILSLFSGFLPGL